MWSGDRSALSGACNCTCHSTLYKYKDKGDRFLFLTGTLLGGAYEYFCSVFTELVFGKVFWDYSKIPFNLGGRINLLYCFSGELLRLCGLKYYFHLWKNGLKNTGSCRKDSDLDFTGIYGLQHSGILCGTGKI